MTKCAGCRVRHLSCDTLPICIECEKSGRECIRLNVRFRNLVCPSTTITRADYSKYEYFFDSEQIWIDTTRKLEFVTENDRSADASPTEEQRDSVFDSVSLDVEPQSSTLIRVSFPHTPTTQDSDAGDDLPDYQVALEQMPHAPSGKVPLDDVSKIPVRTLRESSQPAETLRSDTNISDVERVLPPPELVGPLKNLQEGKLLQHFVTHLAPWFDVGDSKRHFAKVATRMATSSPLLMTVILAIAALHRSRVSGQNDLYDAMTYHDRCLEMIVPMLSDSDPVKDDCVLMTTIILHLYDGLESGNDLPRHLKGTSIFFPPKATSDSSQLRRAVFWLHLRQEIYNACLYQRSVVTDLSNCNFESENGPGDDDMWFHQTLYIIALVLKWAFGEETSRTRWYELCNMVDMWESRRPLSFDPIFLYPRDAFNGRYFPEICYGTDEHVAAAHFFYMSKLLLTTHDPTLPRIGPGLKHAVVTMQETALSHVRTLVGIAMCNSFIPARFTAILAIIVCDTWFTDRREQEALLEFMRDTSESSGWTRQDAQRALIEEWGWEEEQT